MKKFNLNILIIFFLIILRANATETETISTTYIINFWNSFKQLNFNEMKKYYQDEVVQLRYSILRSPQLGFDSSTSGISVFSKGEVIASFKRLEIFLPLEKWRHFFKTKYNVSLENIEINTVENSEPNIKSFFYRDINIVQLLFKPSFFYEGMMHRIYIDLNDIAFVVRKYPNHDFGSLIFIFDKNTHKIKAQTLLIMTVPK